MSYQKAEIILPQEIIEMIQEYIDGECIYIPRKSEKRKQWGETTNTKLELAKRNESIYSAYLEGSKTKEIAKQFFLSEKSIQRIITNKKAADASL